MAYAKNTLKFRSIVDFFKLEGNTHYKHCERTAFLTYFTVGVLVFMVLGLFTTQKLNDVFYQYVIGILLAGIIAGFMGIVYYKIKYKKWKIR